jgi:hypothetical protein
VIDEPDTRRVRVSDNIDAAPMGDAMGDAMADAP